VHDTLTRCHGNVAKAARLLGVSRGLLYRRLRGGGPA
jgi:transcriptional regulator of acetoin/glycerol metabolism